MSELSEGDEQRYLQAMTVLTEAITTAINELREDGMHLINKWVLALDTTRMEDDKRFFFALVPDDRMSTWDVKGMLVHAMDEITSWEQAEAGDEE